MWRTARPLTIAPADVEVLRGLAVGADTPNRVRRRVRIVLGAAEGRANNRLSRDLGVSRPTILLWRRRYELGGVTGLLHDAPRPGRPRRRRAAVEGPRSCSFSLPMA